MSKKLFVGGISWDTTDATLRESFEPFGEVVEVKVVADRDTGRSRGFGFVTFADEASANKAMSEMDGAELDGRAIRVNEAHDKGPGGGRRGRGDAGDRGRRW